MEDGEYWMWQGDGEDRLESLSCPVLIEAQDLRNLIAGVFDDIVKSYPGVSWLYNQPLWASLKEKYGITN